MSGASSELTRVLSGSYTLSLTLKLDAPHRIIVFSDQHKGAGDGADEFERCAPSYCAALGYYLREGYTLVLLGDVEELWEQSFKRVVAAHLESLEAEGRFPAGRYYRIWGNHDDEWMDDRSVGKHLARFMPTAAVYEALRFEIMEAERSVGTILLVHGHQGTFGSDKIRGVSRVFLRLWRHVQRLTRIGQTTPSRDACLRGTHDREMYEWAARQERLVLIAGHTHRAVWSSTTHLQKLEAELDRVLSGPPSRDRDRLEVKLREEIVKRRQLHPPCNDTVKPIPCYYNSGCCKYKSGSITGLELADGFLRLVRWSGVDDSGREVLESEPVVDVFARLGRAG